MAVRARSFLVGVAAVVIHSGLGCAPPETRLRPKATAEHDASTGLRENFPSVCSDGADNDANGLTDCNDPGCAATPPCLAADDAGDATDAGALEACAEVTADAVPSMRPIDIVWIVDSSGSMADEARRVQDNLNTFSASINDSGINHHVVMISAAGFLTVPAPLGTDPDRYRFVDREVGSNEPLERLVSEYFRYTDFLRSSAVTHFVVVSDDNSRLSGDAFRERMEGLLDHGFTLHAVVSPGDAILPCFSSRGLAAAPGVEYWELAAATDGEKISICLEDWSRIFEGIRDRIILSAALPCSFAIPPPPDGEVFERDQVNVTYTPAGSARETLPYVGSDASCGPAGGWYYDSLDTPTQVLLCPTTCDRVGAAPELGAIRVAFGCDTLLI